MKTLPSLTELQALLHYNPETGELRRRRSGKLINVNENGYRRVVFGKKSYKAHRICWKMATGSCPDNQIDHINGDRGDNRIANLRVVSNQENSKNQSRYKNNNSGVTGVSWYKLSKKWIARIKVDGELKYLGSFTDKIDAIYARYYAEQDKGFHENHGRAA